MKARTLESEGAALRVEAKLNGSGRAAVQIWRLRYPSSQPLLDSLDLVSDAQRQRLAQRLGAVEEIGETVLDGGLQEEAMQLLEVLARRSLEPDPVDSSDGRLPEPVCLFRAPPPAPIGPLVDGVLLEKTIGGLEGEDGTMKTTVALAVAVAVAGGLPAFGAFATHRPRRVLLVSEEDELALITNRVEALIVGMGWSAHRGLILGNIYVHALDGLLLDDLAAQLHLLHLQEALGIELMVFDPLADMHAGEENSATAARPVKRFWRRLIAQGCAVWVVMHLGKPREGVTDRSPRGTSAWKSAMRIRWATTLTDDGLELTCQKMSRSKKPDPIRLDFDVITEDDNPVMWREARLTVAGAGGTYALPDPRKLKPSETKVLKVLDDRREESLAWTSIIKAAGVAEGTLGPALRRLAGLDYITKTQTGHRAGKKVFSYSITGPGIAALSSDFTTSPTTSPTTSSEVVSSDFTTSPPPNGGVMSVESEEAEEPADFEPVDDRYFASLTAEGPR